MSGNLATLERRNADTGLFSDVDPLGRYRQTNDFTRELTDLCRKHGIAISGARIERLDLDWKGPDAEQWEQYAVNEDDFLMRGFWNHTP